MDNMIFEAIVFFGMCAVLIAFGFYAAMQGNEKDVKHVKKAEILK